MSISHSKGLAKKAVVNLLREFRGTASSDRSHLYFMKGAVPDVINPNKDPKIFRLNDRLVHWGRNQIKISDNAVVSTTSSKPLKEGQATWFYWYRIDEATDTKYQLIGKLTAPEPFDGTGDLVIDLNPSYVGSDPDEIKAKTYVTLGLTYAIDSVNFGMLEFYDETLRTDG